MTLRRTRSPRGSGEQLREEIVAAAKRLMAAAPTAESVSIRAVADAVGVTPPSIYRHFEDKQQLVTAVVVDVFADLDRAMVAAGAGFDTPLERLHAFGRAYVRFALDHPDHYRLATMDACPRPAVDDMLAEGAWVHFHSVVAECVAAGLFPGHDPLAATLDLWAAAHGIASLMIVKPDLPWGEPDEAIDRVLVAAAYGHTVAPGAWPPDPTPPDAADS
ncbi:MAG TPA: TetR/AcrR family transcriptional regulator [Nocardioides sp.]|uniref:TetR/AcrR family transcriptional regulator n=1 Tax=Nocardioides sp. TaxID=35761 RepID=UPI002ED9CAE8